MNPRTLLATAVAIAATSFGSIAQAQGDDSDKSFSELDTNGDLLISAEEAAADADVSAQFAALDANADGYVDVKEFERLDRRDRRYE